MVIKKMRASEEANGRELKKKKKGMREDQLRLTLGLLYKHDFGLGEEVMAAEEHPFTS